MRLVIPLEELSDDRKGSGGGKAWALSRMIREGFPVPGGVVVPVEAYRRYVDLTGAGEMIMMELNRKPFASMRWEEMWDAALRIRNLFLKTPIPPELELELAETFDRRFGVVPVAVRSSAPGEDSEGSSFAGLHESFVNIRGTRDIIENIRLVWASLWSDAALLYRKELGLDPAKSSMAVVIQELVEGERSGVAFSQNFTDPTTSLIESVWGLNQGLVDGTVSPDRWLLDRKSGSVLKHTPAERKKAVRSSRGGTSLENLPRALRDRPPLGPGEVGKVYGLAMKAEKWFGKPQDVEWTLRGNSIFTLQSRPVTTGVKKDERSWNLSLRRSFENLKALRKRIEGDLIPSLIREAENLSKHSLSELEEIKLAEVLEDRSAAVEKWTRVYWDEFIPFAHGARLFGQIYNDRIKPEDPFSFIDILRPEKMAGTERNSRLEKIAKDIRQNRELKEELEKIESGLPSVVGEVFIRKAVKELGSDSALILPGREQEMALARLLLEISGRTAPQKTRPGKPKDLEGKFLSSFQDEERQLAVDLLDLARASYRLRDEDNIYLGRVERLRDEALAEGMARLSAREGAILERYSATEVIKALKDTNYVPSPEIGDKPSESEERSFRVSPRQITGQPAGQGLAKGKARVIRGKNDLFSFRSGEILVCDAIDPNMTFVVPLASGIVERRGGMLVHGAIIAREYGLACVTGVPDATELIETGDELTVDGYLGIVVIHRKD